MARSIQIDLRSGDGEIGGVLPRGIPFPSALIREANSDLSSVSADVAQRGESHMPPTVGPQASMSGSVDVHVVEVGAESRPDRPPDQLVARQCRLAGLYAAGHVRAHGSTSVGPGRAFRAGRISPK